MLGFIVGLILGGTAGVMTMAILVAGRNDKQ